MSANIIIIQLENTILQTFLFFSHLGLDKLADFVFSQEDFERNMSKLILKLVEFYKSKLLWAPPQQWQWSKTIYNGSV